MITRINIARHIPELKRLVEVYPDYLTFGDTDYNFEDVTELYLSTSGSKVLGYFIVTGNQNSVTNIGIIKDFGGPRLIFDFVAICRFLLEFNTHLDFQVQKNKSGHKLVDYMAKIFKIIILKETKKVLILRGCSKYAI